MPVIAIGTTPHGKWTYKTVVVYREGANGKYQKDRVLAEATTDAKIKRLAEEYSRELGYPLRPRVRHNDPVPATQNPHKPVRAKLPLNKKVKVNWVKQNKDGTVTVSVPSLANPRKRNTEGFKDSRGVFHPIRSGDDYDPEDVGERRTYAPAKRKKAKKKNPARRSVATYKIIGDDARGTRHSVEVQATTAGNASRKARSTHRGWFKMNVSVKRMS